MSIAESIKEQVAMPDVLAAYGFTANRAGFMPCPFHSEHDPSLKIYGEGRGWHCFGCGKGGSVIDFVEELFSIDFRQAVVRLNNDFRLGLTQERPDRRAADRLRVARMKKQRQEADYLQAQLAVAHYHCWLLDIIKHEAPTGPEAEPSTRFIRALQHIDYIEELLRENP